MDAQLNEQRRNNLLDPVNATPEDLNELRSIVEEWLRRAWKAVWTFKKKNGAFHRDSKKPDRSSLTTTARCYMALASVERQFATTHQDDGEQWPERLSTYIESLEITVHDSEFKVPEPNASSKEIKYDSLNNFEVAHLADLEFARKFCTRFDTDVSESHFERPIIPGEKDTDYQNTLEFLTNKLLQCDSDSVEVPFDDSSDSSRHYFVTLHILRAIKIFPIDDTGNIRNIGNNVAEKARLFCIEQCFYFQRGIKHMQDPARLVFASSIYCMYAQAVDREVMVAIVEAILGMQEPSGKWPASHPVVMGDKKGLWYIASAELALCLTWLYFQPKLPDAARRLILIMLESHFRNWIIPTYTQIRKESEGQTEQQVFRGWFDDSAIGQQKVVGWATAIVCNFVANYYMVLNDHINRTVIASLELTEVAERYIVDAAAPNRNPRWSTDADTDTETICWPDLPPIAWSKPTRSTIIAQRLQESWSDPEVDAALSGRMASHVLLPIFSGPTFSPDREKVAGILDGPPGTRKTSLVREISKILQWPYIPVPASAIFDHGFDNMEARASTVFRRLNYLTQCVVFFDEFEEFFRDRKEASDGVKEPKYAGENGISPHNRTIAAFTTSAMLPRLQALHDSGRSLIFLATNHFERIDDAIVRAGRFDFKEVVDHPKVGRFDGSEKGYFRAPTRHTKNILQLESDDDLRLLASVIHKALGTKSLMCLLRNLPENADVDVSDSSTLRIRFSIVDEVAKNVADAIRKQSNGPTTPCDASPAETPLVKVAVEVLEEQIEKIAGQRKGPGPLPIPE